MSQIRIDVKEMNAQDHLTSEECTAWWERKLSPGRLLEATDHLRECAVCRDELLRARAAKSSELPGFEGFRTDVNRLPVCDDSLADAAPSRSSWILPIAAGLALGFAFLWWNNLQLQSRGAALNDAGQRVVVRQDGTVPALGALPEDLRQAMEEAVSSGTIKMPPGLAALAESRGAAKTPESASGFRVLAPMGTMVETPQPILRWTGAQGATGYRVILTAKNRREAVGSPVLGAESTSWLPTESLQANEIYEWQVEALRDGQMMTKAPAPPAPEARFAILPNEKRKELETLRATFGQSHLVMGLACARAGLLAQARSEFDALAQENPESELPKKFLTSLTNTQR